MLYHLFIELLGPQLSREIYRYVMVLEQLGFRVFLAGFISFFTVLFAGPKVISWLRAKKIGDKAQFDVAALNEALASKANTPTMGGVLIAAAILLATLLVADLRNSYIQYAMISIVWLGCVGGADDWLKLTAATRPGGSRQGLFAWEKLVFQFGIGVLIGYFTYSAGFSADEQSMSHALNLPFQKSYENPAAGPNASLIYLPLGAYVALTLLMMTGMSNAVNITDGMDGLATGITLTVSIGLLVLCFIAGDESTARTLLVPYVPTSGELTIVCAATVGACLGFLWFNCAPAQIFMGDTGALFLGGLLGYISVVIRQEVLLLIMSGVFLLEIASVVLQVGYFKWTRGKRIFLCAPYHWHLHRSGWRETTVVNRFYIVTILLVAVALASIKLR